MIEFDKFAVTSYNAIHGTNYQVNDITKINANDLGIIDTDEYTYLMTYSFPCVDLSLSGKQAGMTKNSGTRSGLLWEVERLLNESDELPQILLMENVTQVHGVKNKPDFDKWREFLENKGYSNYYTDLNAKNYGIPQNRNRCFMVSLLIDKKINFPAPQMLNSCVKDFLDNNVDDKYYLNKKTIKNFLRDFGSKGKILDENTKIVPTLVASMGTGGANTPCIRLSVTPTRESSDDIRQKQICSNDDVSPTILSKIDSTKSLTNNDKIRKLTPKECWRLMGFNDDDFERAHKALCDTYYNGRDRANCQLYKQSGNSICVPVLESIFKSIL